MLNFILWRWRQRPVFRETYGVPQVEAMVRAIREGVSDQHRIVLVTDRPQDEVSCETHPLWDDHRGVQNISGTHLPSCYRRLKIFDRATQAAMDIREGDRVVSVDLDAVVTAELTPLFRRDERFVGWMIPGSRRPRAHGGRVFNGSMFMHTAGDAGAQRIWDEFDPARSPMRAYSAGYLGSDQGHISRMVMVEGAFADSFGGWPEGEVLSFTRDVVRDEVAPSSGRIVFFAGARKPWHDEVRRSASWVDRYVSYDERAAA